MITMILRVAAILILVILTTSVVMITGTMQFGHLFPVYDRIQNVTGMNETFYNQVKENQETASYMAYTALILLPFAMLFISLFRREPKPQPYGGYYQ